MRTRETIFVLLLVGAAVAIQGCVVLAVGAGAGTTAYVMGKLEGVEAKDLQTVYAATEAAAKELELNVIEKSKDAMSAVVVMRDSQDKKITINLQTAGESSTKISIRVGFFGDERKSSLIYQEIHENLQKK